MRYVMILTGVAALSAFGCDRGPSDPTASKDEQQPTHAIPADSDDETAVTPSGKVKPLFPQPIRNAEEAKACTLAALESDRKLEELSGAKSEAVTKLLEDCVAQYDESMRGVTKFYPGGVRVRYFLRSADVADVNVFVPEASTAVIHLRSISLR